MHCRNARDQSRLTRLFFKVLAFETSANADENCASFRQNDKFPRRMNDEGIVTSVVAGTGFEPVTFRL